MDDHEREPVSLPDRTPLRVSRRNARKHPPDVDEQPILLRFLRRGRLLEPGRGAQRAARRWHLERVPVQHHDRPHPGPGREVGLAAGVPADRRGRERGPHAMALRDCRRLEWNPRQWGDRLVDPQPEQHDRAVSRQRPRDDADFAHPVVPRSDLEQRQRVEPHGLERPRPHPVVHGPDHDGQPAERGVLRELPPTGLVRGLEHDRRRVHDPYPAVGEANNSKSVTMSFSGLQVCPTGVTAWSFDRQIVGSVSVSSCLEISGSVSITDGGLYVDQGSDGSSRAYVKILSGGRLTLVNATVWSNYPLPFYVSNGGTLVTSRGSSLTLAARGSPGMLREEGPTSSVTISDTAIDANVTSVTTLAFTTDDGNANTVDLDIRNTTFNQVQTSQLVFGGTQNVQLTSVQTFDPNDSWWVGMITGGAQVSRYWWLHVNAVDGTGTLLADANVHILLQRLDPNTLTPFTVPDPAVDDIYFANTTTWPVSAPSGSILYRAFAESRTTSARILNNSYLATGSAVVDLTTYQPDAPASALVTGDTLSQLTFSSLTPDLSITAMSVLGGNG